MSVGALAVACFARSARARRAPFNLHPFIADLSTCEPAQYKPQVLSDIRCPQLGLYPSRPRWRLFQATAF